LIVIGLGHKERGTYTGKRKYTQVDKAQAQAMLASLKAMGMSSKIKGLAREGKTVSDIVGWLDGRVVVFQDLPYRHAKIIVSAIIHGVNKNE